MKKKTSCLSYKFIVKVYMAMQILQLSGAHTADH